MNARQEFTEITKGLNVLAAEVRLGNEWDDDARVARLMVGHSADDFHRFLTEIDFDYDNGYGSQQVFGSIHCEGCTIHRHEYDGAENWFRVSHAIPSELQNL